MKKSKGEKRYPKNRYHERSELLTEKDVELICQKNRDACNKAINLYEEYIKITSRRYLYDEYGNAYVYEDPDLQQEMRIGLIDALRRRKKHEGKF